MNWYEEKQERRRERLEARAEKLRREGEARVKSGMDRLRAIPFGQPILVGHYSEKRDRNYRRKACDAVSKGFELQKAAGEAEARAANIGSGGISSDDPDAVVKLKEELQPLEEKQAKMVQVNKLVRKKDRAGLAALGYSEKIIEAFFTPDFCGRIGYAAYELQNNSANIRRIKQRIEQLLAAAARPAAPDVVSDNTGIRLVQNQEINRVQLFFPGKPSQEIRSELKSRGFRWSPMEGAWQRHLNGSGIWAAQEIFKKLTEGKS